MAVNVLELGQLGAGQDEQVLGAGQVVDVYYPVSDTHLMCIRDRGADVAEAQHLGQLFCSLDSLGGVLLGGGDDEVGRGKADLGGVLDAGSLTACHRVAGDELHALALIHI